MSDSTSQPPPPAGLLARALIAFAALPGIVAFALPLLIARARPSGSPGFARSGLLELVLGSCMLLWCVRDFYEHGRGTLAPWSPPSALVRTGLYQWTRNPMYVGVLLIVIGWALGLRSSPIGVYALILAVLFHLRVVFGEEPWLAKTFGADWAEYRNRVPRWVL
jgi:protein-S-isoprenylcysteine O-methyltransferase Ste14